MIQASYEQLIERISHISGIAIEEIKRKVEAKRARLSGLISLEGAAQIVASELGISFEKQQFKIIDLLMGMKKIQVTGKVLEIYPIRKFSKGGRDGEIASVMLADNTSSIRAVFWDTKHIEMIKDGTIKRDDVIEIKGADVRGTTAKEIHLSSNASIDHSDSKIDAVVAKEILPMKKISGLKVGERASIRASIVQAFQPKFFGVCPECMMKISYENEKAFCAKHGVVVPKQRVLASFVVDDGTDSINAIMFNEHLTNLLKISENDMSQMQNPEYWPKKKRELLGAEMEISGRVRNNAAFERDEFIAESIHELDPEQIIQELS
ncbi:MAG: hypothetical protein WC475_03815 [Candidatus Paceibacterota bacterium]